MISRHRNMLAISKRSLCRPTVARPEALVQVASPRQAQLEIFDLALIPIVEIHPRIDHMKLYEHARRQNLSLYFFFPVLQVASLYIHGQPTHTH
jgi:hypothetical protein